MGYTHRNCFLRQAKKHKKKREDKAAQRKETEQDNFSAGLNLDEAEDLIPVPDHFGGYPQQLNTSDGEPEGGLLFSGEGRVTLAQLLEMEPPDHGNLEMEDAEESDISCSLVAGDEDEMSIELADTDLSSVIPGLPTRKNATFSHLNPNFSREEICTYELITLLDNAGAPRYLYGRLLALLRKQSKEGFKVKNAFSRDVFLRRMQEKFNCPTLLTSVVSDCTVFRFPFNEMLQDLVDSHPNEIHLFNGTPEPGDELWNTSWMHTTFLQYGEDFDLEKEVILPIILYMDKTGTDAYQRYSLEPVLFSLAVLSKEKREERRSWRHLGFIPSTDQIDDQDSSLQFYHHTLGDVLMDLKKAQTNPPTVQLVIDGHTVSRKARLPLMLILGDQLSQDTLTARCKSNSGGAGRVHRACMCSYLTVDDPDHNCVNVCSETLGQMTTLATMSDNDHCNIIDEEVSIVNKESAKRYNSKEMKYLRKRRDMFKRVLNRPYTSHAVNNAFEGMDFGSWSGGVYDATFDDFMHGAELGLITYIGIAIFGGLKPKECESLESKIRPMLTSIRSSVRREYPRWRVQTGFSRQTLMTSSERVGSLFSLALSLQIEPIRKIVKDGHVRQAKKYQAFPPKSKQPPAKRKKQLGKKVGKNTVLDDCSVSSNDDDSIELEIEKGEAKDYPFYHEGYFTSMDSTGIMHTLEHMCRHGLIVEQVESLDKLQINQLMTSCFPMFTRTTLEKSYPRLDIADHYSDLGSTVNFLPDNVTERVKQAMDRNDAPPLNKARFHGIQNVIPKHYREKPKIKGEGSSSAVLSDDKSLVLFIEYVLCFHSFSKYSSSLPHHLRDDFELVDYGGRNLIRYFEKMIYRGDNSLDARTTKIHAQKRTGLNYNRILSMNHTSCETGERMLKTEAKGISRTAQQRGHEMFEKQTCHRIGDRMVMDKFGLCMFFKQQSQEKDDLPAVQEAKGDRFTRQRSHFILWRAGEQVQASNRFGKHRDPDKQSGNLHDCVIKFLLQEDLNITQYEVYTEVILRNDSYIRAWPNYRQTGAWYDYVQVQWESGMFPARVLCFYNKIDENGDQKPYALVHVVDENSKGKVPGTVESLLTTHFRMAYYSRRRNGRFVYTHPVIRSIPVESIDSSVMGCLHKPSKLLFDPNGREVMIVRPRNEWAYLWLAWNEVLRDANKIDTSKRRKKIVYVSLGDNEIIRLVRANVEKKLEIPIELNN
jgi:hypothetical protein